LTRKERVFKNILYTACFFGFCLIDQRTKTLSGLEGWAEVFRDLTVALAAILVLAQYKGEDYKRTKAACLLWTVISVLAGGVFVVYGQPVVWFLNHRMMLSVDALLAGLAVILTVGSLFSGKKKKFPGKSHRFRRGPFALWTVMMLLMVVSRSGYIWPLVYFIVFGCFYLADMSEEEQEVLTQGMLNGVIAGFFLLQGFCFVFRPYDAFRYVGIYNNSNINAFFYLEVLAAVFGKLIWTYRKQKGIWWKLFYWLGAGVPFGFLFLTISRTGWLTGVLMAVVCLLLLTFIKMVPSSKSWMKVLRGVVFRGILLAGCFLLTFPLVFGAVRYLPPLFHHPVWFYGEWNEDKVHSWDPWDSEKFVTLEELMNKAVGRVAEVITGTDIAGKSDMESQSTEPESQSTESEGQSTEPEQVTKLQQQLYEETRAAGFGLASYEDKKNVLLVRKEIYRYYANLLNLWGHPDSELGFQILPNQRIGHAHNIYLQFGVMFGIPVMLVFVVLVAMTIWTLLKRAMSGQGGEEAFFVLAPAIFGCLEFCWGAGSLSVVLLFIVWKRVICKEKMENAGESDNAEE